MMTEKNDTASKDKESAKSTHPSPPPPSSEEEAEIISEDEREGPPSLKEFRETFMGMAVSQFESGFSEIAHKLTPEHIDKMIDQRGEESERDFKDRVGRRRHMVVIICIGIALIVFLTLYLAKENEEIFMRILIPILTFLGGGGLGYGLGTRKGKD